MLENYEYQLLDNDLCQTESILQVLSNLERLEIIRDSIFNKINEGISSRVLKLEQIKGRIIRASHAVALCNQITDAVTIKSKYYYPEASFIYANPINFNSNAKANEKASEKPMNSNPKVGEYVGKMPRATIEDTLLIQSIYNTLPKYNDVSEKLASESQSSGLKQNCEFDPIFNYLTSNFDFLNRNIIKQRNLLKSRTQSFFQGVDSIIVPQSRKRLKAKPQEAPKSIVQKDQLKAYSRKVKTVNLQDPNKVVSISLPENIFQLVNIANFNLNNSIEEEVPEKEVNVTELIEDDIINEANNLNDTDFFEDLPIDLIQSKKADASLKNVNPSQSSSQPQMRTYTNYIASSTVQSNPVPSSVPSSEPSVPVQPSSSSLPLGIPSVPNQPKVICNNSPGIPIPPPLPFFPVVAEPPVAKNANAKGKGKENPKAISSKPNPSEIKQEEKASANYPKQDEQEEDEKDKPQLEERGKTMQDLIGDNPIAKLKKLPTKKEMEELKDKEKAEDEKYDNKPVGQQGLIDVLKQQIQLRYKNLRKHEESSSSSESD